MSRSLGQKKTECRFLEYCLTAGQTLLQLYMVMCLIGSVSRCDGESISLRRGGGQLAGLCSRRTQFIIIIVVVVIEDTSRSTCLSTKSSETGDQRQVPMSVDAAVVRVGWN